MTHSLLNLLYFSITYLAVNILVSCSPPPADSGHSPLSQPPVLSPSEMGGVHGGGGDVASERAKQIVKILGVSSDGKNAKIKELLIQIVDSMSEFSPDQDIRRQIALLIEKGLKEDIVQSKYLLKQYCANEERIEKSASTNKVDLSKTTNVSHPDICINVRKLALEKASTKEIVGLLIHEHARHFGLEDTNDIGIHPLALAVSTWYPSIELLSQFKRVGTNLWLKEPSADKKFVGGLKESIPFENLAVMSNNPENIFIQVKVTNGLCAFRFQNLQMVPASIELGESKKNEHMLLRLSDIPVAHSTFNIYTSEKCNFVLHFFVGEKLLLSRELEVGNENLIGFRIGLHPFPKIQKSL